MTQGIFFTAYGKRGYIWSAYNFAFSLKHFNPDIHITLYHDESLFVHLPQSQHWVFDTLIKIPDEVKYSNGKIDPAKIKVSVYDILPYDYTLYLDVDAIALKDITPVFDDLRRQGGYYYTHIMGFHTIDQGDDIGLKMIWAWANDIWSHYNLPKDAVLPCTNSSFQFIKKCDESKALFDQIKENINNPIPLNRLKMQWGGGQPDELYLNIALAQKKITGQFQGEYLFLGYHLSEKTFDQITNDSYILSLFGGRNFTKLRYTEWAERLLHSYHRSKGLQHFYKHHLIIGDKHANTRQTIETPASPVIPTPEQLWNDLLPGKIPISETKLVQTDSLISEYPDSTGRGRIRVTNWTNPSFIEFEGKKIFVYRMEARPFCVSTKLGICLLDDNYQPLPGSSAILSLHSDLWNYGKGFHVEDPRLFIYKDELYLSYTDGYQMGQAKIDVNTLTATESYYIDKPDPKRTEKNWVFFQHEDELLAIYDTGKQEIFRMNKEKWERVSESPFNHSWKYGELRGGTSPVRNGDEYLSFFHSSAMVRRRGRDTKQYFIGAYTFEAKPPFRVTSISKESLVSAEYMSENIPRFNNKIYVVFPGGVIREKDGWAVAFGFNDTYSRIAFIKDDLLKENLIPVKSKELIEA